MLIIAFLLSFLQPQPLPLFPIFHLFLRFDRLTRNTGLLTLADLSALPELHGNPFVPMLFAFLCREAGKAKKNEALNVVEFGRALESLNGSGSRDRGGGDGNDDSLAAAVFRVLDCDCDGKLSLDELEGALRPVLRANSGGENDKSSGSSSGGVPTTLAAGAAMQRHDGDGDGRLSLPEFRSLLAAAGGK